MQSRIWIPAVLLAMLLALQSTPSRCPRSHRAGHFGNTAG